MRLEPSARLGLRENWQQFTLLVLVNAFVGATIGLERSTVPLLAVGEFGLVSGSAILSFIASFGLAKATANLVAGRFADHRGRKPVLVAGWLFGLPVPLLIIWAPSWEWVVGANLLLGINQGLCWSTTAVMKIDLVGPTRRGLAMGINEFAGYLAVGGAALAAGYLASAYALRPYPFLVGLFFVLAGLALSLGLVRETQGHAQIEARLANGRTGPDLEPVAPSFGWVILQGSWRNRTLFATSQAGLVNNLNDAVAWGLFPLVFAGAGRSLPEIAALTALYPGTWGLGQLATGALSDRWGRRPLVVSGMWVQALAIAFVALGRTFPLALAAMVLLGIGTAMVYPTLIATVSDVAHPSWRASAVGVYRLWRDGGYVMGALLAGLLADGLGVEWAIGAVGGITFGSGLIALLTLRETSREREMTTILSPVSVR